MNKLFISIVTVFLISGCSDKGSGAGGKSNSDDSIAEAGFEMIKGQPVGYSTVCDRFENMEVIERIDKTAGALKYPAYIIGYNFDCLANISGKEKTTFYIGFMSNTDKGTYECIHWHKDKDAVYSNGWTMCGGLN